MSRYVIDPITGEVVHKAEHLDLSSPVMLADGLTPYELAKRYEKSVTAKVDGRYVGWTGVPSFCRYKAAREYAQDISEITYWHHGEHGAFCRMHVILLKACGHDVSMHYSDQRTTDAEDRYYSRMYGQSVPQSDYAPVSFKWLYGEGKAEPNE